MSILSDFGSGFGKSPVVGRVLACALALGAGVALADDPPPVPEVVTDVSGYVELTANGHNNAGAFAGAGGGYWSDGAAPGGGKDYIVQKNRILRTGGGGGTFAGRSLTLDNGRIKTSGDPTYTLTINDLRMYGGRVEQSTGSSTKTLAGRIHVLGTAANPSRISGSSGRFFRIGSTLEGDETGVVKVMMTEEDAGQMNSSFFDCWFDAANADTYRGSFRVEAGVSTTGWGRRVALCATSLANLGAGDPNGTTPVITLKDRAAFFGSAGMMFDDPAYSIAIEKSGTIGGRHTAGEMGVGVTFGGGVAIRGAAGDETLYILGERGAVKLNDVKLENLAAVNVEHGTLILGADFANAADIGIQVSGDTALGGTTAAGGRVAFNVGAICAPGDEPGARGALTVDSATVTGTATLRMDLARTAEGALSADRLVVKGKLVKNEGAHLIVSFDAFPEEWDWEGSVRLVSAPNLGEADGFGISDVEVTGFPYSWTSHRDSGTFRIEEGEGTKHLVWVSAFSEAPVVRILPLGDSITFGSQSTGSGYRQPLYDLLVNAGYRPDFVGTLKTANGAPATDPDHEGHRGWVIAREGNPNRDGGADQGNDFDGLYEHVEEWLGQVETPHIILLHVGTNDLLGDDFAHAKDRLGLLVDRLTSLCPDAWVVVTTLLNRYDNAAHNAAIDAQFNPFVKELARSRRALGRGVAYLDLNAVVPQEELADGLHPNDVGYGHMAEAWFGAIQEVMPSPMALPIRSQSGIVTLTGVNARNTSSWDMPLQWSDGRAPHAGGYYFVPTNRVLRTPESHATGVFAGESLVLNGGNVNLKHFHNSTAEANWVIYGGSRIAHGCNGATDSSKNPIPWVMGLGGTLDVRGTAERPALLAGSGGGGDRTLRVTAQLIGDADAVLAVGRTAGEGDSENKGFTCQFTADNSAYRGRFTASATGDTAAKGRSWEVSFDSTASLGAPFADGAKLRMGDGMTLIGNGVAFTNGYDLAIEGSVVLRPNGARALSGRRSGEAFYFGGGVHVTGVGAGENVLTLKKSDDRGVVAFDDVAFYGVARIEAEYGAGLRIYPGYNQPELPIVLAAWLADSSEGVGPVTLKAGGALQPGVGTGDADCVGRLGVASLTVEAGGQLRYSVIRAGDALSSDFIRVAGDIVNNSGEPIEIVFDRYPNSLAVGTRIPLLSAANLGRTIQAADFRISCVDEFLNAHIRGAFEVEEIDGAPTLVFVQSSSPVVIHEGTDTSGTDSWASGLNWSDHQPPSAEKDYLVPDGKLLRRSTGANSSRFAGRSLSIINGGDFAVCGLTAQVDDLRLFSGGIISTRKDGDANRLKGVATVFAAKGSPFCFEIERGGATATRTLNLEAQFRGAGDLCFRYYHAPESHGKSGEAPNTFYLVTGDNTAFTGGVELRQRAVCVDFKDEAAMGGPAPAFRADRLLFASNATLRCSRSYVMRDPTRGITIGLGGSASGTYGGTIRVLEGQTLVVSNRIAGVAETALRKYGSGTLALCCATNTFSGRILHWEGVIAIGAADAVAQARFQSPSYGGVWRVDAPEGMTVASLDAVLKHDDPADPNQALRVRPLAFATQQKAGMITANLVRFKGATAADAETALARVRLDNSELGRNWSCELATEAVEDGLLVTVTARRRGMTIYIR